MSTCCCLGGREAAAGRHRALSRVVACRGDRDRITTPGDRSTAAGAGSAREVCRQPVEVGHLPLHQLEDRKSTRLNSSHANISYAVFCLKKKKKTCSNNPIQLSLPLNTCRWYLGSVPTDGREIPLRTAAPYMTNARDQPLTPAFKCGAV